MERGGNVIPRNSSVAKFVVSDKDFGFVQTIQNAVLRPEVIHVVSGFGKIVFFGSVAIWALKKLYSFKNREDKLTELEKEMMMRKIKSRKEKDKLKQGEVEVVQEPLELRWKPTEIPKLDKQELMKNILESQAGKDKLMSVGSSSSQTIRGMGLDERVQEIRAMAREAREIELREQAMANNDKEQKQTVAVESSSQTDMIEVHSGEGESDIANGESSQRNDNDTQIELLIDRPEDADIECLHSVSSEKDEAVQSKSSSLEVSKDVQTMADGEIQFSSDTRELHMPNGSSTTMKPRIILSIKEARDYLSKKGNETSREPQIDTDKESTISSSVHSDKASGGETNQSKSTDRKAFEPIALHRTSDPLPGADIPGEVKKTVLTNKNIASNSDEKSKLKNLGNSERLFNGDSNRSTERKQSVKTENWIEKNFHEVEPIIKKMGEGIRDNYKLARDRADQHTGTDITNLEYINDDSEYDWMKDDDLREIVFQVRDNELSGKDPFYLINAEDKLKFFKGLEEKVEKENEKLLRVHEYLHSNIENLDYGADGISLYDEPEKFKPRWKRPPLEKNPEFLTNSQKQQTDINGNADNNLIQKSTESLVNENSVNSLSDNVAGRNTRNKDAKGSKTIIEGSDGSVRAGKKSGKEFWQHTKKWSRGFLESYNAESDPEAKSIMKDMGKDLDRWITEAEIQEAADLMNKLPERNKKFMEKKMDKLKREMELFGPQAVVSKYREYADHKEEDYLWWLDLPHILCIELYATQNGEDQIGFYSLEMAADLELEPKPRHVIAFEDAGDCKNFCYIVQAHMDMLANGHAFVVPRPPKDAFRDAKASGFGVTVIRKKELQLNIDSLEEVEEQITEIGSKMYHDGLMRERSIDISALTKGVFGFKGQPASAKRKKKTKRALKKPRNNGR
ncbi:uncharacterized protein LOC126654131 isoform X2 [Mercurialis annua]|nr:uncharacterized protein LOC126654131 isoform X2 [Mercurialis annua]